MPPPRLAASRPIRRVLITGHRGLIGWWTERYLRRRGYEIVGFDARDGDDVRDLERLRRAAEGCDALLHCAVLQWNTPRSEDEMREVNLVGARNALEAARRAGHVRIIVPSSVQAFGAFEDGRLPEWLPIGDSHPLVAEGSYGRLKAELEGECAAFAEETGIPVFCPRPVRVMVPGQPADITRAERRPADGDAEAFWLRGAWVDVRDVARAIHLEADLLPFAAAILAAEDSWSHIPTAEGLRRFGPDVPVDDAWLARGHHAALFDNAAARELLAWEPLHRWAVESRLSWAQRGWGRLRRARTYGLQLGR